MCVVNVGIKPLALVGFELCVKGAGTVWGNTTVKACKVVAYVALGGIRVEEGYVIGRLGIM